MTVDSNIQQFLEELEAGLGRKMEFRREIAQLIDAAVRGSAQDAFWQMTFDAKFALKTNEVMKRIGPTGDGYQKLTSEFQSALDRITRNTRLLLSHAPPEVAAAWGDRFLTLEPNSFSNLMILLGDLARMKNWEVDGRPIPAWLRSESVRAAAARPSSGFVRVQRISVLAAVLMIAYVLVDPPVTLLGWLLAVAIGACVVFLILQTRLLNSVDSRKELSP